MSPPPIKPMLGDYELPLVQEIRTEEARALARQDVPGLEGAYFQDLGRHATSIFVRGVIDDDEALQGLERLREAFQNGEPLPFVADILTATTIQEVLISDLRVREVAGHPNRYVYWLALREYLPPPPPIETGDEDVSDEAGDENSDRLDDLEDGLGVIEVEVILASGERDFDIAEVQVEGTTDEGEPFSATITEHVEGLFTLEDVPAGEYTVRAVRRE